MSQADESLPIAAVLCGGTASTGAVLTEVARRLTARGWRLCGVVQSEPAGPGDAGCEMSLTVLPQGLRVDIGQALGREARGCRLDHHALEDAVGLVDRLLTGQTQLLVINKFGKRESEGAGFRQTIARALERGIPVLLGVGEGMRPDLDVFVGGGCTMLPEEVDAIVAWCEGRPTPP